MRCTYTAHQAARPVSEQNRSFNVMALSRLRLASDDVWGGIDTEELKCELIGRPLRTNHGAPPERRCADFDAVL